MKVRFAVSPHGASLTGPRVVEFALALEDAGFDGIWLSDVPLAPVLDPLLGLALAAGRTEHLRLGANVVPLGRNPFLLAKELAQLDQLSAGRLLLNFVIGLDQPGERAALGVAGSGSGRGETLEQSLALIRRWWRGEVVDHDAPPWSFAGVASAARPVQDPLEVWLGGRAPRALERAGRIADGWLGAQLTPAEAGGARERIQSAAAAAGREFDPEHFGLSIAYARTDPAPELLRGGRAGGRAGVDPLAFIPVGAGGLRALLGAHIEAGLSKFVLRPLAPVDDWAGETRWLAGAVLDLQT